MKNILQVKIVSYIKALLIKRLVHFDNGERIAYCGDTDANGF